MTISGKKTQRRYTPEQKENAVRLVRLRRAETGERHGSVKTVADQLGYGVESVRAWVEQELREFKRTNAILRSASAFFAAELDRPHR